MDELRNSPADKQIRALAYLRALEQLLLPVTSHQPVSATHLATLDQALDLLRESGEDVEDFRFPPSEILTDGSREHVLDRDRLYVHVIALIDYFAIREAVLELAEEMTLLDPAKMIGFKPSRRASPERSAVRGEKQVGLRSRRRTDRSPAP